MENYKETWRNYFDKYIDNKEYKIWDMDTSFFVVLGLFKEKIRGFQGRVDSIEVKEEFVNDKGTPYFSMNIQKKNVTPSSRKNIVSWGAMRQYLCVLDLMQIIKFNGNKIRGGVTFDIINDEILSEEPSFIIRKAAERILIGNKNTSTKYGRNAWFSLMLSLLYKNDPTLALQIIQDNQYKKAKERKEKTSREILDEIQYTYKDFVEYMDEFFSKFFKDRMINMLYELEGEKVLLIGEESNQIDKVIDKYITILDKRRINASRMIRIIREYEGETDLVDIKSNKHTLDAAHILSYKKIKYQMLMEFSKKEYSLEVINQLIDMIDDMNNIILIPHNYHYLLDKNMLTLTKEGEFKMATDQTTIENFGIVNNAKIKKNLMNEERVKYILMQ
ncbi:MAG4270 family putative restriction endonuclease [Mycoplasma todarodis]|uniref:MAG4270 family putative restriction endonuclease n=1 Tax=Mycoplasma todarodis TaxID=1937191 RepID=UPI003B34EF2C